MPKQVLVLDSSQISLFGECPQKWAFNYLDKITISNTPAQALTAGTFGHHILEDYYRNRFYKVEDPMDRAICKMKEILPENYPLEGETQKHIVERLKLYGQTYGFKGDIEVAASKPRQKFIPDENGNLTTINTTEPLVEQGFSYELLNTPEYLFVLEGRVDVIGYFNGILGFMDHKFQLRKSELHQRSLQFRNYSLALELDLGIINYIRLAKEVDKDTLKREVMNFPAHERRIWKQELTEIYIRMAKVLKEKPYKERSACPGKYGHKCEFVSICDELNPLVALNIKNFKYIPKVEWKPW